MFDFIAFKNSLIIEILAELPAKRGEFSELFVLNPCLVYISVLVDLSGWELLEVSVAFVKHFF